MAKTKKLIFFKIYKNKKQKGFTLIELLIVISIISLLASILAVALHNAKIKAMDVKNFADIKTLGKALELYNQDKGHYPFSQHYYTSFHTTFGGFYQDSPNDTQHPFAANSWETVLGAELKPYLNSMPTGYGRANPMWVALYGDQAASPFSQKTYSIDTRSCYIENVPIAEYGTTFLAPEPDLVKQGYVYNLPGNSALIDANRVGYYDQYMGNSQLLLNVDSCP